jgi:hypothetical protein
MSEPMSPDDVMDVYVPGRWRCPKCDFQLSSATLFMGSGEIGYTGDQVMDMIGECCPNDGTPMGRVTWREEADANRKWGTDLMEEIIGLTGASSLLAAIEAIRSADSQLAALRGALSEIIRLRLATSEGSLRVRADRMWECATKAKDLR